MTSTQIIILTLVLYKLLLLFIGFWASRRVNNEADFFLAGQGLGPWVAGLSYAASTSSAWVLLGFTGAVYSRGMVALWLIPGIFGGYLMTWLVIGPKLNRMTTEHGYITVVDFITDGLSPSLRRTIGLVCAFMILFCFVFYISSQFQAAGNAFTSVFAMSGREAVLLGAAIIVIYCLLGGFWAASITDALQAMVMMAACVIVPAAILSAAGGMGDVMQALRQTEAPAYFSPLGGVAGMAGLGAVMGLLGTGLGALGQPQLLNRIMATKDQAARRRGAMITIGWGAIIYTGLIWLAFSARALSMEVSGEALFFTAAKQYLPPVMAGIVIAAILSAVMSTVDSLLLSAASAVSHDSGFTYATPDKALLAGRVSMVAIAILAVLMTLYLPKDIFTRVLFAWVALGAAFGPIILTKAIGWEVRGRYVLIAIVTGFIIAIIGYNLNGWPGEFIEKWLSWAAGLIILYAGRVKGSKI